MSRQTMSVAIVIPTYNEVENIGILLGEIKKNVPTDVDYEIVVVDDNSPDGTWKKAVELLENNIFVVRRIGLKGLSTAVIDGIIFSSKDYALVLDADLQHPPEYIKDMISEAQKTNVDVVIGSRYTKGGGVAGWSKTRLLISKTATLIAKLFLPSVRRISDPMSGFFMVKRRIVLENLSKLNPYGFKILLEILERCNPKTVSEVPYIFRPRIYGKSKLGAKTIIQYILHVMKLSGWRPFKFVLVGLAGMVVNLGVLQLIGFLSPLLINQLFAVGSAISIEISVVFNFVLHEVWTFRDRRSGKAMARLALFHVSSAPSVIVQYLSAVSMKYGLSMNPIIAQLIGILIGFPFNYIFSELGIWKRKSV
ncbi:MAG: glycosyltransferase family 2 protein [Ignisphaera sp.]